MTRNPGRALDCASPLARLRRTAAPIASAVLFFFAESALAPAMAWARPGDRAGEARDDAKPQAKASSSEAAETPVPTSVPTPEAGAHAESGASPPASSAVREAPSLVSTKQVTQAKKSNEAPAALLPEVDHAFALPSGDDKSGVTSKAISLPQGSGKIQGMGESFSAQLSTGIATFSVPFSLPHARGGAQPTLGLNYSSGSGSGLAGLGWDVGVPFIARQTDRGLPSYVDGSGFDPNQDHFVFNGGQELVPICVVTNGKCAAAANENMPSWSAGAQYFRPRIEGSFMRFFWAPDHRT